MGKRIDQLREERAEIDQGIATLEEKLGAEDRDRTPEEVTMCDEWETRRTKIDTELDYLEAANERARKVRATVTLTEERDDTPVWRPDIPGAAVRASGIPRPLHEYGYARNFAKVFDDRQESQIAAFRFGQWALAAIFGKQKARDWCEQHEVRTLTEGNVAAGGFLVPHEMASSLIRLVEEYGVMRREALTIPMGSDTYDLPISLTGLTAYFPGEAGTITASQGTFGNAKLTARKMATLTALSSELDEDAVISVGDLVGRQIATALATKEDDCGFLGDGSATYGGVVGLITAVTAATASVVTSESGNTTYGTLDLTEFQNMMGKLPEFPGINPRWYISKPAWAASMMRLADAAGGNTAETIEGRRMQMFLGYPVVFCQRMNSTLTSNASATGGIYFGDMSMSVAFGSRRNLRVDTDSSIYFTSDQIAIRGTERFDINCHLGGAATTAAGPMISLTFAGS